jgi:hypothetical protein
MNYIMRVIVVTFVTCASHFLYGAEKTPVFSLTEWLFRHLVLTEPHAEHANPYAWRIDSTKTAAAIACVDKEWKMLHKKYIADPRAVFMQTHQQHFDAVHLSSLLFNRYTQCCCLVSKDKQIKALFGIESQLNVINVRPWRYGKAEPEHISSTTISYYDAQQQKIVSPAFQTILHTQPVYVILPSEKQCYSLFFKHFSHTTSNITSYAVTLPKLIQATFNLSEDKNFWHYRFEKNGITVERELANTIIEIDLSHDYFIQLCYNLSELDQIKKYFESNPCGCDTNSIDLICKAHYDTVCEILTREDASQHKTDFLKPFFERHIRHKIGHIQVNGDTKTIYINPYGTLFRHSLCNDAGNYSSIYYNYHKVEKAPSIDELQKAAVKHACSWRVAGNLVLTGPEKTVVYKDEQIITYLLFNDRYTQSDLAFNKNYVVIDGTTVRYDGHTITIFVLKSDLELHLPRLLFRHYSHEKQSDHHAQNQDALKKGLAYILREKKKKAYFVATSENNITAFMQFIKGFANPITDIKNIYPSEDFYAKNPFLILL